MLEPGHIFTVDPAAARRGNERLVRAIEGLGPIGPAHAPLRVDHMHFGGGAHPAGHAVRPHRHDQIQVQATITGRFVFTGDQSEHELRPGQACLIGRGCAHGWRCEEAGVLFGGLLVPERPALRSVAFGSIQGDALLRVPMPDERELVAQMVRSCVLTGEGWAVAQTRFALGLWLSRLLERALRPTESPTAPGAGGAKEPRPAARWGEAAIQRAVDFIHANFGQPIAVADIANEAGLSERHLARLFRQQRGASVQSYLAQLRLESARHMVRTQTDKPLKAIARACGFRQPGYFSRCYRAHFGYSPSEDRPPTSP